MKKIIQVLCSVAMATGLFTTMTSYAGKADQKNASSGMPPAFVTTAIIQKAVWQDSVKATGSLTAYNGIMIKSETSGRVTKIFFKSGDYVKAGTPLVEIYPDIIKGQLKKAEAQLELSKINYVRYEKLYQKGFYTKADLDQAFTNIKSNEGDVDQLKAQLVQTLIRAPFDGLLGIIQISLGDYLTPGKNIVNLQALNPIWIDFNIPESYFTELKIGQGIDMKTPAVPNQTFSGTVSAMESAIDKNSRLVTIRASIPNEKFQLLPGTYGEVTLKLGQPQEVILAPQSAITYSQKENYVYRIINQKAVKTPVTLGERQENNQIIITKGLHEKDIIVAAGQLKLHDGATVSILPSSPNSKSTNTP